MPELPEVETLAQMLRGHVLGLQVDSVMVRRRDLRWPILQHFEANVTHQTIQCVSRRSKYIIMTLNSGVVVLHLGMSGQLKWLSKSAPWAKHDHVIWTMGSMSLRFCDPRRFGSVMWYACDRDDPRLQHLGPEPLTDAWHAAHLLQAARRSKSPIKHILMNSRHVVGVGNIYANEALFMAGIDPRRPAQSLLAKEAQALVDATKCVLQKAIDQGGTTLKDFAHLDGKAGYFQQILNVYGGANTPCKHCGTMLEGFKMSGRQTVACPTCQS